jgi:phage gp46-like protein
MTDWLDIALLFDPATRRTDVALGDDGDLLLDETPVTPMLVSIGSDRRARRDDELPTGVTELNAATSFILRRGWAGDALDARAQRIGSRLWLLDRAKQSELTRRFCEVWAAESLEWVKAEIGRAAEVTATWLRPTVLALTCSVDGSSLELTRRVS